MAHQTEEESVLVSFDHVITYPFATEQSRPISEEALQRAFSPQLIMPVTDESFNTPCELHGKLILIRCLVDGVWFELSEELIQKRASQSLLGNERRRARFFNAERNAYVFEQPAGAFEVLVYFISTGLLTRPLHVSTIKLHTLLRFFEMDEAVIDTFKSMEHLAFETHWEETQRFVTVQAQ